MENKKLSGYLLEEFIARCQVAYNTCYMQKSLYSEKESEIFNSATNKVLFGIINNMAIEHTLLEITKLHDAAIQGSNKNLSIEYVVENGNWENETKEKLVLLKKELDEFYSFIKPARNRALCHNDLKSILKKETLGTFDEGSEDLYFSKLEKFINIISMAAYKETFEFNPFIQDCISNFIKDYSA